MDSGSVWRVYGTAAILATLLMLASTIGYVTHGEGINVGVVGGVIGVWSALAPISFVVLGILLWRTAVVPRSPAMLLAVGGVLLVASRPERIDWLALIADGVLVLAMVPIGRHMVTRCGRE